MTKHTNLEIELEQTIKELNLTNSITVSDIKSLIWNETNHLDLTRLFYLITEKETNEEKVEKILNLLQEAWNTFPHKLLGGLSPKEKVKQKSPPKNIVAPKSSKKLPDLFPEKYPEKVKFIKIDKSKWGFEFPGYYYDLFERLYQLDEQDISAEEYEKELKTILRICPETFDAARELAEFYIYNRKQKLAKEIYKKTIDLARSCIPKTFISSRHHIIWAYLDNRPFLRLLAGYAQFIEKFEGVKLAIPHYQELISFNPNDNQGIRELLATAYLQTNQLEELVKLSSQYPNDILPAISMGEILALFKLGKIGEAGKKLKKVGKHQKHIIEELLKPSHPKPENLMEDRVTVGGEDEAYYYWQSQGIFWANTKGVKEFLEQYLNQFN